jgi:hypothetical protein
MAMRPVGLGTKNYYAGEGQQQLAVSRAYEKVDGIRNVSIRTFPCSPSLRARAGDQLPSYPIPMSLLETKPKYARRLIQLISTLKMEAACTSKISVILSISTRYNNPSVESTSTKNHRESLNAVM